MCRKDCYDVKRRKRKKKCIKEILEKQTRTCMIFPIIYDSLKVFDMNRDIMRCYI